MTEQRALKLAAVGRIVIFLLLALGLAASLGGDTAAQTSTRLAVVVSEPPTVGEACPAALSGAVVIHGATGAHYGCQGGIWVLLASGGGGGETNPGGTVETVQFHGAGTVFAGDSAFTFDPTNDVLGIPKIDLSGDAVPDLGYSPTRNVLTLANTETTFPAPMNLRYPHDLTCFDWSGDGNANLCFSDGISDCGECGNTSGIFLFPSTANGTSNDRVGIRFYDREGDWISIQSNQHSDADPVGIYLRAEQDIDRDGTLDITQADTLLSYFPYTIGDNGTALQVSFWDDNKTDETTWRFDLNGTFGCAGPAGCANGISPASIMRTTGTQTSTATKTFEGSPSVRIAGDEARIETVVRLSASGGSEGAIVSDSLVPGNDWNSDGEIDSGILHQRIEGIQGLPYAGSGGIKIRADLYDYHADPFEYLSTGRDLNIGGAWEDDGDGTFEAGGDDYSRIESSVGPWLQLAPGIMGAFAQWIDRNANDILDSGERVNLWFDDLAGQPAMIVDLDGDRACDVAVLNAGIDSNCDGTAETGGGSGGAPTTASYITQTPDATLEGEQALSSLNHTGLVRVNPSGVLSSYIGSSCADGVTYGIQGSGELTCQDLVLGPHTQGILPLAQGGTGNATWIAGRCVQVSADGTKLEVAAAACGSGGGGGSADGVSGAVQLSDGAGAFTDDSDGDGSADLLYTANGLEVDGDATGRGSFSNANGVTIDGGSGGVRIAGLTNCDTIDTDADGDLVCGTDGGGTGSGGSASIASGTILKDDFLTLSGFQGGDGATMQGQDVTWTFRKNPTTGGVSFTGVVGAPSVMRVTAGEGTPGAAQLAATGGVFRLGDVPSQTWKIRARAATTEATDQVRVFSGFMTSGTATDVPTTGVYLRAESTTADVPAPWFGVCHDGTTESTVDLETTLSSTFSVFEIAISNSGGTVSFLVDGVNKGSCAANVPSGTTSMNVTLLRLHTTATGDGTNVFDLDAWEWAQTLDAARW